MIITGLVRFASPACRHALLVGALLALGACGGGQEPAEAGGPDADGGPPGPPPALVRVGEVTREQVIQHRLVTGRLEPAEESRVAAEEPGRVVAAPPDAGVKINQDRVLAKLDTTILDRQKQVAQAELDTARASIAETQARLDQALAQRRRLEPLVDDGSVTQADYDLAVRDEQVARAQLKVAQANVAMRQAAVELIEDRLVKMTIHAPFTGYITARHTELGQWLSPGEPVVTLSQTDPIDAILDVPEFMIDQLNAESRIDVRVPSIGLTRTGRIHRVVPDADRRSRTFPVEVRLDNADGQLRPGMSVEAQLPLGQKMQTLLVPRDAVQTTPTGMLVYVNRGGNAVPVNVRVLFKSLGRFVVEADLRPGEQVVTEGNERLRPGQPLNVQNAQSPPAPNADAQAGKPEGNDE